jgi:hypothetical protein
MDEQLNVGDLIEIDDIPQMDGVTILSDLRRFVVIQPSSANEPIRVFPPINVGGVWQTIPADWRGRVRKVDAKTIEDEALQMQTDHSRMEIMFGLHH